MTGRVVTADEALAVAVRQFAATGDVDMAALAAKLNVSRATLYRVVGGRDRLLGDVLWERGRHGMRAAEAHADGEGMERVLSLARAFNQAVASDRVLQLFLRNDPATAFRVLFGQEARVHARFVEAWRQVLAEEVNRGRLGPIDIDATAFLVVRLGESILYADLLAGRSPGLELPAAARSAVLRAALGAHDPD